MRFLHTISVAAAALVIAACNPSKKTTGSAVSAAPPSTPQQAATPSGTVAAALAFPAPRPNNGVFAPGNEELIAIQAKFSDVTLQTLNEGHAIYTGVCTNCHGAKSIYNRPVERWPDILNNMAPRSKLTDTQKDAVYKYVLAVKATQPAGN